MRFNETSRERTLRMTDEGGERSLRRGGLGGRIAAVDNLEQSICEIVAGVAGVRRVTPGQRLYHDLGLSGDDACEVIDAVSERFGTRFSGLRFEDYFPGEAEGLIDRLERLVGVAKARKALTVSHLAAVAGRGEWFDP